MTLIVGNLPGEPQPEVTVAPALELEVARCGDCPFNDSHAWAFCHADPDQRSTEPNYGETFPTGRPDWCPLERGDVVVRLRR